MIFSFNILLFHFKASQFHSAASTFFRQAGRFSQDILLALLPLICSHFSYHTASIFFHMKHFVQVFNELYYKMNKKHITDGTTCNRQKHLTFPKMDATGGKDGEQFRQAMTVM